MTDNIKVDEEVPPPPPVAADAPLFNESTQPVVEQVVEVSKVEEEELDTTPNQPSLMEDMVVPTEDTFQTPDETVPPPDVPPPTLPPPVVPPPPPAVPAIAPVDPPTPTPVCTVAPPASDSKKPRERMSLFIDGVDITKIHEKWVGKAVPPGPNKHAAWWYAFHEAVVDGKQKACCNLCGIAGSTVGGGTKFISRHLRYIHKSVYLQLKELNIKRNISLEIQKMNKINNLQGSNVSAEVESIILSGSTPSQVNCKSEGDMGCEPSILQGFSSPTGKDGESNAVIPDGAMLTTAEAMDDGDNQRKTGSKRRQSSFSGLGPSAKKKKNFKDEALSQQALKAQILCAAAINLSPEVNDDKAYQEMLTTAAAAAKAKCQYLFSSNEIVEETLSLDQRVREQLKTRLESKKVILTLHEWKDRTDYSFSLLSFRWIEGFKLHAGVVAVNYSDGEIGNIGDILDNWGIKTENIPLVVSDTEHDTVFNAFLTENEKESIFSLEHQVNQVADIAFAEFDKWEKESGLLERARSVAMYFKTSQAARKDLETLQREEGISDPLVVLEDVVSRWWSTSAMLERLFQLQQHLEAYNEKFGFKDIKPFEPAEWEALSDLRLVLEPLGFAQKWFEGIAYPTSSMTQFVVFSIFSELQALTVKPEDQEPTRLSTMATCMIDKFKSIFGENPVEPFQKDNSQGGLNNALLYAHALDPRFKSLGAISKENKELLWQGLLEKMLELQNDNSSKPRSNTETTSQMNGDVPPADRAKSDEQLKKYAALWVEKTPAEGEMQDSEDSSWRKKCEAELAAYKAADATPVVLPEKDDPEKGNPLLWWNFYSQRFPILWKLAEVFLAIPAASASVASSFSSTGAAAIKQRCIYFEGKGDEEWTERSHFLHENSWLIDDDKKIS